MTDMRIHARRTVIILSLLTLLSATINTRAASGPGLLVVHPDNPRYLMVKGDTAKKIVYLTGAHTWAEFQTYKDEKFDYTDWLSKLAGWKYNFMRGWMWEDDYYSPLPFKKKGGKYDLKSYNLDYFKRLKKRIEQAADRKIYVSVMLFEGWSVMDKRSRDPAPWPRHPYNINNNINGINGDPNGDGDGREVHTLAIPAVTALQEAYVKHFIDELNKYDHIIWEIGNECNRDSAKWQYHMIDYIKSYEASKPKQHLVWLNLGEKEVFDPQCHAEVVSPGGSKTYFWDPPAATGRKVVIADSDHIRPLNVTYEWAWKSFTRGLQPILMDCKYQGLTWWKGRGFQPKHPKWQKLRDALSVMLSYANKMNLVKMVPQKEKTKTPSGTGYCLYEAGKEYMVYQPAAKQPFTVELPGGVYRYEWINPVSGKDRTGTVESKGGNTSFTAPFPWPAGLYLKRTTMTTGSKN
ncbi:MAG: hypothetical protein JSV03_14210 [Planctomycetota bacterium]|nr:MAG: hypothetical protein JSV03_14210 [Planctomycetota bacterium]